MTPRDGDALRLFDAMPGRGVGLVVERSRFAVRRRAQVVRRNAREAVPSRSGGADCGRRRSRGGGLVDQATEGPCFVSSCSLHVRQCASFDMDIAGFDVTVDNMRLANVMDILKAINCFILWHKLTLEVLSHKQSAEAPGVLEYLNATRFFMAFHVVDGNCPVNELLEMFSTCRGRTAVIGDSGSCSSPLSRLKLTSRTLILLEETNSHGSELCDRLRRSRPVRLPRDGEMCPSRPFDCKEISVTVIPSQAQQFLSFRHDMEREPFSCSVQELVREAKEISSRRPRLREDMVVGLECVGLVWSFPFGPNTSPKASIFFQNQRRGEATATGGDGSPDLRFRLPLLASATAPLDCSTQCQGWPGGAEEVEPLLRC
uniref:Uncharacterized protein n=1 Tax=Oryza meridionalis TaxID=40149 RepID=A0A0E0CFS6_9ORYZ